MRPCPFAGCKYHLLLEVTDIGNIKQRMDLDDWLTGTKPSCVLDVADRGGMILEDVGALMDITRERVRQIEAMALDEMRSDAGDIGDDLRHN